MDMLTRKEKLELIWIGFKSIVFFVVLIGAIVFSSLFVFDSLKADAKGVTYDINTLYAKTAMIYELDRTTDTVYVVDSNGEAWSFTGCEDYELGDYVSMIMYTNNTKSIYDDSIVSVRYSGYTAEG